MDKARIMKNDSLRMIAIGVLCLFLLMLLGSACTVAHSGNNEDSISLENAKKKNENAPSRCIGLTVETRPDWFRLQHADNVLNLGATRVELGIQTVFDDVLNKMERGHTVTDSINATRIAKESGFKVCYHMMPGLPGSDEKRDIESFETRLGVLLKFL